jgi:protein phosphatase
MSAKRVLKLPNLSMIVLIGASGSGKSTFARTHFLPTEIVSSDECRGLVSDDDNDQSATPAAFELLHFIVAKRLELGRLVVVDATNVQDSARKSLLASARTYHVFAHAIVFDLPRELCEQRNAGRPDRDLPPHVVRQQTQQLRRSIRGLQREGFARVHTLRSVDEIDAVVIERERVWNDRRDEAGPFDIIGDVHGCHDELMALLADLGYPIDADGRVGAHPQGRRAVFLGDLVDRGPAIPAVLRTVMQMVGDGGALCIPGNHENKLGRALNGRNVKVSHGLADTLAQLEHEPDDFRAAVKSIVEGLVSHYVFDDGRLVVAHAGLQESMQGRTSGAVRSFALYGDTTGETDEFGLPVRYPWADDYRGRALVVYGHTPVPQAVFHNNTICVDTGCVYGGSLTALRYPERELVSVPAARQYYEPTRPLAPSDPTAAVVEGGREPGMLDVADVLGKRILSVSLLPSVTIREENAIPALEVMSRFALDPRWLVYLPPTMAPTATTTQAGLLEHPQQAFDDFRRDGIDTVICEEKHMGSRAVVVVCRDAEVAARRFLIDVDAPERVEASDPVGAAAVGACFTRTGRPFFTTPALESSFLARVGAAVTAAGLWDALATDWLVLDAELLPWSFKAGDLLRRQYASVGAAAVADARASVAALDAAAQRGVDVTTLLAAAAEREVMVDGFVDAYRRYCWPVDTIDDLQLAPFQILAGEGEVHARRDHRWHLDTVARLVATDPVLFKATPSRVVDLSDPPSGHEREAIEWWEQLTASGGEGMVVKPVTPIAVAGASGNRLVQPGIKCRGREYLRIIYGPEYTAPANLERLRHRGLGHKRSLALREFALGIEALDRFVGNEPLYRVHECVFGVLALESEPVDPRL